MAISWLINKKLFVAWKSIIVKNLNKNKK
jgi:hypothetical protein